MRVLVIPDVHLKPWIFDRASELLKRNIADRAVCLMDIPDDWKKEYQLDLYKASFDSAIRFQENHPDTLWCYGNHDLCYLWDQRESGYSYLAPQTVNEGLRRLTDALPDRRQLAYIHRIDNVLFLHGGLIQDFVKHHVSSKKIHDVDHVLETINGLGCREMWRNESPIWHRPLYWEGPLYKPRKLLQVVGHTPVDRIRRDGNTISCDVFSTYRDGNPIGTQEYLLIDTETWEYKGIKSE